MKFILGKKLSMTQLWRDDRVVPVTCIQVEPCVITQVKTKERDGYRGVQIGTGRRAAKILLIHSKATLVHGAIFNTSEI